MRGAELRWVSVAKAAATGAPAFVAIAAGGEAALGVLTTEGSPLTPLAPPLKPKRLPRGRAGIAPPAETGLLSLTVDSAVHALR